jgi:hypothetical protein
MPFHQEDLGGGGKLDALFLPRSFMLGGSDVASRHLATYVAAIDRCTQERVEFALYADLLERLEGTECENFSSQISKLSADHCLDP